MVGACGNHWGDGGLIGPDRTVGKILQSPTMRKIGIEVASMTLRDATGILPEVRFSNLYFGADH